MPDFNRSATTSAGPYASDRAISTAQLLGQVMFLVAVAIGFLALGTVLGRDLEYGTARILSFAGFGMLLVSSFGGVRFRVGAFAMGWLFATATMIGLGLGPVIAYFSQVDPGALTAAAGGTALTVAATGSLGFALSKDLARWMRPLSMIVFGLIIVSLIMVLSGSGGSPILSGAIALFSAALIVVNFNYLRKHGTEDHAVMLATGIFVSIVNIFISLLNIFSSR